MCGRGGERGLRGVGVWEGCKVEVGCVVVGSIDRDFRYLSFGEKERSLPSQ